MAITTTARRRVRLVCTQIGDDWLQGIRRGYRGAVSSLRDFAELETDPAGQRALRKAADVLEEVHKTSPAQ
jgi:hypothetical protein